MSTKEIVEFETRDLSSGNRDVLHLHHEGSFFRAYEWSAFLACRYLHDFKVTKRVFKGIEEPVAYIGFPELVSSISSRPYHSRKMARKIFCIWDGFS